LGGFPRKVVPPPLVSFCVSRSSLLVGVLLKFDFFDVDDFTGDTKSRSLFIDIGI
jgi:hypothetical protein